MAGYGNPHGKDHELKKRTGAQVTKDETKHMEKKRSKARSKSRSKKR